MNILILLAAGEGHRMGAGKNKVFLKVDNKSVVRRSAEAFLQFIDRLIVVYHDGELEQIRQEFEGYPSKHEILYIVGGSTRQDSVFHAFKAFPFENDDIVLIHDAARCMVDTGTIERALRSAQQNGSGLPCLPMTDTVKVSSDGLIAENTPSRSTLFRAQTPQCFKWSLIQDAYWQAEEDHFVGTDDASLVEYIGGKVFMTEGSTKNIKLTSPEDLRLVQSMYSFRIGHGYDVHRLTEGRKLILCGVEVPHSLGLLGHSDADVAVHALMDAILGALGLWDIGHFFPDTDQQYKDISSMILLERVMGKVHERDAEIINCDITIVAQKPKLAPYIHTMRQVVASAINCPESNVNIKATTTERLGFEGKEEGISAQAVCLLKVKE